MSDYKKHWLTGLSKVEMKKIKEIRKTRSWKHDINDCLLYSIWFHTVLIKTAGLIIISSLLAAIIFVAVTLHKRRDIRYHGHFDHQVAADMDTTRATIDTTMEMAEITTAHFAYHI